MPGRRWCAGLLAAVVGCGPVTLPPSAPTSLLGELAPEFTRVGLDGRSVALAGLRGRVVVVEIFARYCKPCWKHLPKLQRWSERHPEVAVVGIGVDEFASDTAAMVAALGVRFPVVHDGGLVLSSRLRVDRIPATLVLDREGRLRWRARTGDGVGALDQAVEAVQQARD